MMVSRRWVFYTEPPEVAVDGAVRTFPGPSYFAPEWVCVYGFVSYSGSLTVGTLHG